MKVVIVGPNLRDQSQGAFHVHAQGCGDLRRNPNLREEPHDYVIEAETFEDVAEDVYADHMAENPDLSLDMCVADFHFAPCAELAHRVIA